MGNCYDVRPPSSYDKNEEVSVTLLTLRSMVACRDFKNTDILNMYPVHSNVNVHIENNGGVTASYVQLKRNNHYTIVPTFFFLTPSYYKYTHSTYHKQYATTIYTLDTYLKIQCVEPHYKLIITREQFDLIKNQPINH